MKKHAWKYFGHADWKGDPYLLARDDFKQECVKIFAEAGMDTLMYYLFFLERANEMKVPLGTLPELFVSTEEECRFAEDEAEQSRLREIAATIIKAA